MWNLRIRKGTSVLPFTEYMFLDIVDDFAAQALSVDLRFAPSANLRRAITPVFELSAMAPPRSSMANTQ